MKIRTKEDLSKVKEEYSSQQSQFRRQILVCGGGGCVSANCKAVYDAVVESLKAFQMEDSVDVIQTGCMGCCALGPLIRVEPEGVLYLQLSADDARRIVRQHIVQGKIVEQYTYYDENEQKHIPVMNDMPFFKDQVKIALRNCGSIDATDIRAYIGNDGYAALANILEKGDRKAAIETLKEAGLRGRGGAGFPTGVKWEGAYNQPGEEKYIICNADEGDPGAFMDRSVFEGDPHSVIEGLLIGGWAIGANQGVVYIRAEYPLATERLSIALGQAREAGLLGKDILGSGFDFDIEIRIGAGAFVCGEETALMASVEGKRGEPRQKPPFPFQRGLFGKPTIINNVETLATVPAIMLYGAKWFRQYGTEKSPGTKVFALSGDIVNTGLVEVPMGTPLSEVVFKIGGGIPDGKKFKAAQTGGPSGGCITAEYINIPLDYESLTQVGSIVGSGGLIVMDEDTCMVDTARFYMDFIQEESCGKCTACRIGTKRMLEILERITTGRGMDGDIEVLQELGSIIKDSAMCGLGQTAPNPVLSTIRFFRNEYEEHIYAKHCRASICADMFSSPCENTCPAGINIPGYMSLIATGDYVGAARIMMRDNPFPGICGRVCTHPCEYHCRRATVDEAMNICELKRFATDWAYNLGFPSDEDLKPSASLDKKVAIVGGGPAGLTCGYYLARLGYKVDVYEAERRAGGIMFYGIPDYRLPTEIVEREVGNIERAGVNIILNTKVGEDISFDEIKANYDSIFIGIGAQRALRMGLPGEDQEGIYHGLEFLRRVFSDNDLDFTGKKVAVIGGGNTALDAARTAVRIGADKVVILYRRERKDMPADPAEIRSAEEEGIEIRVLTNPSEFLGEGGKLKALKIVEQRLGEYDSSGRQSPVPTEHSYVEEFDVAIPSISQEPETEFVKDELSLTGGKIDVNPFTNETTEEGIFAGGDVHRGPEDIVNAVYDGKLAASRIDKYLGGTGELKKGFDQPITDYHIEGEIIPHNRFLTREIDADTAIESFIERNLGMHELDARAEASRCLRCDRREE